MKNNLDQDSYIAETIFVVAIFATELGERNANKKKYFKRSNLYSLRDISKLVEIPGR